MKSSIEAIIFLSKERVKIDDLIKFFNVNFEEIEEIILNLCFEYKDRGINFCYEDGYVFLKTNPLNGEDIKNYFTPELKIKKLSNSSFEVLAIIAYKGPITKSEIEYIKGSGIDHILPILLEKKLIYISGKKKVLGNPNLYDITKDFLAYIGLKEKDELLAIDKASWFERKKIDEN